MQFLLFYLLSVLSVILTGYAIAFVVGFVLAVRHPDPEPEEPAELETLMLQRFRDAP